MDGLPGGVEVDGDLGVLLFALVGEDACFGVVGLGPGVGVLEIEGDGVLEYFGVGAGGGVGGGLWGVGSVEDDPFSGVVLELPELFLEGEVLLG